MTTTKKKRHIGLAIFLSILLVIGLLVGIYAIIWNNRSKDGEFDTYVWNKDMAFDLDLFPSLVIAEDSTQLKIMQIADQQLKFGDFHSRDRRTMNLIDRAIDAEQPDIVVCTGDITLSIFTYHAYKVFADYMEEKQQYWTLTFGNHDDQHDSSKYTLSKLLEDYEYCLYTPGPSNVKGVSNYLVNIYKGETAKQNGAVAYSLVMLDSNTYPQDADIGLTDWIYDWFGDDQVLWYEWAIKGLQAIDADIQTSAYFHMPLKESAEMYYSHQLSVGKSIPDAIDKSLLLPSRDIYGTIGEKNKKTEEVMDNGFEVGIFYQGRNTGFFDKAVELGSTKLMMYGHDHANTLRGYYGNVGSEIYLGYGLCCGYHTYPYFEKDNFLLRWLGMSDDPLMNLSSIKDHNGNPLQKGFTHIAVDLNETNYGSFQLRNVYDSQYS